MAQVPIPGAPPGGGGIPGGWRTLAIGGGILAALVVVLLQRGRSGGNEGQPAGTLSTSANVALGQVAYETRTAAQQAETRDHEILGRIQGLGGLLGEHSSALSGQLSGISGQLDAQESALSGQISGLAGQLTQQGAFNEAAFGALWEQGQAGQAAALGQSAMNEVIARQIWGYLQGISQEDLLAMQGQHFGWADNAIVGTIATPPPWTLHALPESGPFGTEDVADEPGMGLLPDFSTTHPVAA